MSSRIHSLKLATLRARRVALRMIRSRTSSLQRRAVRLLTDRGRGPESQPGVLGAENSTYAKTARSITNRSSGDGLREGDLELCGPAHWRDWRTT